METEKLILETLKDWNILVNRLNRLKKDLAEKEFRITPTLSDTKVFVVGVGANKLENHCFARLKILNEIDSISRRLKACLRAYDNAGLTEVERLTISYTIKGKSLLELSKSLDMKQARIYRIRDKAIKKMALEIRNEVFLR